MATFTDGEVLTAADLNAALAAVGSAAAASAAASTTASAAATKAASAAAATAAAAVPASTVGQPGGPAGPLSAAGAVPLAQVGLKAGTGITIAVDGTVSAAATTTSSGGYDAYVVFQAYTVDANGTNVGGGPVILASKGVSGVDSKGAGVYQINLSPAAPSANFLVSAFAKFDEAANDGTLAFVCEPRRTPGNPTSSTSFLQIVGGYQGSSTSVGTALFLYRIGITFV